MKRFIALLTISFFFTGCAELLQLLQQSSVQKPTASVTATKLTGLSFTKADLLFDIKINNPNGIAIDLAGLDYGLKINESSLFSGTKNDPLNIEAKGSSTIQIPLSLKYDDIYKTVKSLTGKGKSSYTFEGGLSFDLPVLGKIRLPLSKTGELPLLKLPKVKLKDISMKNLSWSGASMQLDIAVKGSGGLDLFVDNLAYGLKIAGKNWVSGKVTDKIAVNSSGEKIVSIPFKLDFLSMGKAVYDIATGDAELNYNFDGDMNISSDHPLLKAANFSFEDLSKIKISK
ncbi:MAG: hypothetical protein D8M58_11520 [Calditrichaeota bacterium]|nr:MAG: hypothetical protein DWQ03_10895 [Calditrichota bacterium]MBL1206023.1 hypothetical protein [Calditrichota bacterium]NOG45851.1 LEA type 2 family protein [Calditrichota bacterium]